MSVVIPNWNGEELLRANLPVLETTLAASRVGHETIVVDDGSDDSSVQVLEGSFPWVKLVKHDTNRGFGAACWSGVSAARNDLVLLLNTDVRVLPGFLDPLVEAFDNISELFSAASVSLEEDGETVRDAVRIPHFSRGNLAFRKFGAGGAQGSMPEARPGQVLATMFATGGHALYDRQKFLALGGFQPLYAPFYWEDIDLGYRGWKRGWPVVLVPASQVIHNARGTIRSHFERAFLDDMSRRNRFLFTWRNITSGRLLWIRHLLPLACKVLTRWLILDIRFYRVLGAALRKLPAALEGRREEKCEQRLSDQELWPRFGSVLEGRRVQG